MANPVINLFGSDSFSSASLTKAILEVPNQFPALPIDDMFAEEPISTTVAQMDVETMEINLVPKGARGGGKAVKARQSTRGSRFIDVPSRRIEDSVAAVDIQNKRQLGVSDLETLETVVIKRQIKMAMALQSTRLYLKMQALQGKIVDPDGDTLYDSFTELGLTRKAISFDLGTATTLISSKMMEAKDYVDEKSTGSPVAMYRAYCSPTFFRSFVEHANVKDAYKYFESVQQPLRNDVRSGFVHGDVEWINVPNKATVVAADGSVTTKLFVPDTEAVLVPVGAGLGIEFLAPADHIEFANTNGLPLYSWSDIDLKNGKLDLVAETDSLPFWSKPLTSIRLTTS
mgnify:FL=1